MTYDLYSLGWQSFQQLCLTIAREVLGQTVQSFLDSNDAGRDGAFTGIWSKRTNEVLSGRFVIQCKFTSKKNYNLRVGDVAEEITKVKSLVKKGLCDCYLLMTNAGVGGKTAAALEKRLLGVGVKNVEIFGSNWICDQIRASKRLRTLVPRVYGLGDLSEILDERAYAQARALIDSMREDLAKIVVTESYRRAAEALGRHGFVLLVGEPAAGKTTIASLLAMAAVDQWKTNTLKLEDPSKVVERWNPIEPSQFFWVDDAFGVTQYEAALVRGWNHVLPQVRAMLRQGAKIVMTSRDYIYNRARKDLKSGAFPLLQESQVVIDVHDLTAEERRQILYNHLKLGRQPKAFKSEIKEYLEGVASNPRFIPETARRLSDPTFTSSLRLADYALKDFVEKQERFLMDVLQALDADNTAALALIYMRNGALESPVELQGSESLALQRLGSDLGGCLTALAALGGSLVQYSNIEGRAIWRFKHPTIGDAFSNQLVRNPELLEIYLRGSPTDKLINQITCGDVGLENATIVPNPLFSLVILRLREFSESSNYKSPYLARWSAKSQLHGFLARRCSREFLSLYLQEKPSLLEEVSKPGLYLDSVSEVDVVVRLHEYGLLPETNRKTFVDVVGGYALSGEDLYGLRDNDLRTLFTKAEFLVLRKEVREELVPRLGKVRHDWVMNHSSGDAPEEYMQPLLDSLETLKNAFPDDQQVENLVKYEAQMINEWIAENEPEESSSVPKRTLGTLENKLDVSQDRSIFDDVDI